MENNDRYNTLRNSNNNLQQESYFHNFIKSQLLITNHRYRGLKPGCEAIIKPEDFFKRTIEEDKPVSHLLDVSCFDLSVLNLGLNSMLTEMSKEGWLQDVTPEQLATDINVALPELLKNILIENISDLQNQSNDLGISLGFLSMIGGFLTQPALRLLGDSIPKMLLDAWEHTPCPICGRMPSVVIKPESAPWVFKCSFCRTEYKMDIFACPNCKIEGSESKEFHLVGENQEYEIAECKECGRYYKIINTARLKDQIPEGLEDSFTRLLDNIAANKNLVRLDE